MTRTIKEDFEGSEEAQELPNVIQKCHKKPTVSEMWLATGPIRRIGAGVNVVWQVDFQTFLTDPDDQIRGL